MAKAIVAMLLLFFTNVEMTISSAVPAKMVQLLREKVPLNIEFCRLAMGYSETAKINFMQQTNQSLVQQDRLFKALLTLSKFGCSELTEAYTCATYAPPVIAPYGALPPCRSLCKNVKGNCDALTTAMAKHLANGECKMTTEGGDYRGKVSQTFDGVKCQAWDTQEPHRHSVTAKTHPNDGLESNYCRNPDGESKGPWCYTTSGRRWDYCAVPKCKVQFYCNYFPEPSENQGCVDYTYNRKEAKLELLVRGNPRARIDPWAIPEY
uniref:Blue pigment protein n=1 Tax=Rhizostoma pulmo TaxID=269554 RepID=Q5YGP6_RHIPL|nr:blue pigment protein precursor [Rhizostoma pulmo]